jgi:RNA polymerase sigma-70 factor (ECF subfamily)
MTPVDLAGELRPLIPALRRFAYALTHDLDAADDLVQDCLERAVAHWPQRRGDGNVRAWAFAILHRAFLTKMRATVRRGLELSLDELTIDPTIQASAERAIEIREVLAALACLSADHRAVLTLVAVEGFTYEEAAETLGVPVGTVMSRLSRARLQMRQALEPLRPRLRQVK